MCVSFNSVGQVVKVSALGAGSMVQIPAMVPVTSLLSQISHN